MSEWKRIRLRTRFLTVSEFPYLVNRMGKVKSEITGKILKPFLRGKKKGTYPCVDLYLYGERHRIDVHRLVALLFIPNPEDKPEVNHLDLDHMNYRADNLEWCTREENEAHKRFMTETENFT